VWDMEGRLGVALPFRFPLFKALMWHAASHYVTRLQAVLAAGVAVDHALSHRNAPRDCSIHEAAHLSLSGVVPCRLWMLIHVHTLHTQLAHPDKHSIERYSAVATCCIPLCR
jgi:Jumonji helical domain